MPLKEQYFLIRCSLFTIMRFLKRFIQLDDKLLRYFFIIQYSTTPLLQILNTPVEPIHGTTTRGSGLAN